MLSLSQWHKMHASSSTVLPCSILPWFCLIHAPCATYTFTWWWMELKSIDWLIPEHDQRHSNALSLILWCCTTIKHQIIWVCIHQNHLIDIGLGLISVFLFLTEYCIQCPAMSVACLSGSLASEADCVLPICPIYCPCSLTMMAAWKSHKVQTRMTFDKLLLISSASVVPSCGINFMNLIYCTSSILLKVKETLAWEWNQDKCFSWKSDLDLSSCGTSWPCHDLLSIPVGFQVAPRAIPVIVVPLSNNQHQ